MPIIATPGAADANSYATVLEATAYNDSRLYASAWADAEPDDQIKALQQATRMIDSKYVWNGIATFETQALGFPRTGLLTRNGYPLNPNTIPQDLINATSEFARQLLATDKSADNDIAVQGITSIKAGSVALTFKEGLESGTRETVIPSAVNDLIPPSWYTTVVTKPAVFRAV